MRSSLFTILASFIVAAIVSTIAITNAQDFQGSIRTHSIRRSAVVESFVASSSSLASSVVTASDSEQRVAERLAKRIRKQFGFSPMVSQLVTDIARQKRLLAQTVTVTFANDEGTAIPVFPVTPDRFIRVNVALGGIRTDIDSDRLADDLREHLPNGIRLPVSASLLSRSNDDGIERIETDGIAKSGYEFDANDTASRIRAAFETESTAIEIPLRTLAGRIVNTTGEDLGELELLASGRSNYAGSGNGRKSNVHKGLTKYLHNILVQPGEEFSINAIMKRVPIREWEMALGIFNGGELRPVAGGGICQVATTLYRGILHAGLPVTQRANHSLFVHYYEKYGVGIDATIFPSSNPDLRFVNDTGKPLLIQSYIEEGEEATLNIYGTPDGRTVRITGPYFADNAPEDFRVEGKKLSTREIAWVREVTYPDGNISQYVVFSRYKSIPRSVVKEYSPTLATTETVLHASAPIDPATTAADLQAKVPLQ